MPWWYAVAERDHDIQNPTSPEKIRLLGERLRLTAESHVLDIACGKGVPAVLLASAFGCQVTGVERAAEFAADARARVAEAGLRDRIEIIERDAAELELEAGRYDVAMCLGASFIWDGPGRDALGRRSGGQTRRARRRRRALLAPVAAARRD
jgi:cyclopropane fatty-acyl-phospholipid synthase-like methyltransferase